MVEAAGVEPASLEPSAQTSTSIVSVGFRASSLTTTHEVGGTLFRLDSSPFLVFFARCRRPSSLTSIQSRTGQNYAASAASSVQPKRARISSASASEGATMSTLLLAFNVLMEVLRGQPSSSACNLA